MGNDMDPQMRRAFLELTPEGRAQLKIENERRKRLIEHATRGMDEISPGVWVRPPQRSKPHE